MTVTLKPELQRFIDDQVKNGRFSSSDEALEAGIAQIMLDSDSEELDPQTLAAINRAEEQINRDEGMSVDEAFGRLRNKFFGPR